MKLIIIIIIIIIMSGIQYISSNNLENYAFMESKNVDSHII